MVASIVWYLKKPRQFNYLRVKGRFSEAITGPELAEWSYQRCHLQGRLGWRVLFKNEMVTEVKTMADVEAFILEKLTT